MKKKFLKVMIILLICLLSFEAGTILVNHSKNKKIDIKQDTNVILDNEEISNNDIENEIIEINSESTEENSDDRQVNEGKSTNDVAQKNDAVSKEIKSNKDISKETNVKINDSQGRKTENKEQAKTVQVTKQETTDNEKIKAEQKNAVRPELKAEEKKTEEKLKCIGNNHFMDVGNSGKWFDTEDEAIALYNKIIKEWGPKWENFEIDDATYYKNCPYRLPRLELYMWQMDNRFLL